jgi:DNA-binding protein HU-beta
VETRQKPLTNISRQSKVECGTVLKPAWIQAISLAHHRDKGRSPDIFESLQHISQESRSNTMAKGMTKTALVKLMAEKMEFTNKQTAAFLELLAETAVKETKKNGEFTIPGIGKLVKAERKARLGRNPQTGETIKIKAKTVVKFRVAKVAKDTIAPVKK